MSGQHDATVVHKGNGGLIYKGLPLLLFTVGMGFELLAGYLLISIKGASPVDELMSLLAVSVMSAAALWYVSRLGQVPVVIWLACLFVVVSKLDDVLLNLKATGKFMDFGGYGPALQGILFAFGAVLTVVGVFQFAGRMEKSRRELAERNEELLRKRAEQEKITQELAESRLMLQLVIDNIPESVYWKDKESQYLGCNTKHARLIGVESPDMVVGKTDTDFSWLSEHAGAYLAMDRMVLSTRRALFGIEEPIRYRDGSLGWLRTNKAPLFDQHGEIMGVLGTSEDITTAKQREDERARLITVLEQTEESVLVTDTEGTIQYVNPSLERTTGYSASELIGRTPRVFRSDVHDRRFYEDLWGVIRRGEVWHGFFINRRKDGTLFEEAATISPVRNDEGEIINYVSLKRDVTQERRLERQLRQALKMEAIGKLAGGVAHDFNNLLQVISGYTEMALTELPEDSRAFRQLEMCRSAITRAARLVRQLLLFGQRQTGQPETLDLNQNVTDILKIMRRFLGEQIELVFRKSQQPLLVYADPGQMEQVVMNLCLNARDAMPDGGLLALETSVVTLSDDECMEVLEGGGGEYACLSVSDTGTGMPPEVVEHIFEPFYSTKETGHGTGLGLATVYGIIQQHRGIVRVQSKVGQGTTFRVYLPVMREEMPVIAALENVEAAADIPGGQETILLAEDEDLVRMLATEILEKKGYHVIQAADGAEAIRLFDEYAQVVGLVLVDMVMPKANGRQVFEHVRKSRPGVPVLFCSGYSREITEKHPLTEDGGTGLINKPYNQSVLLRRVRDAIDKARLQDFS